jgi:tRNA pseudouridine13 synthase
MTFPVPRAWGEPPAQAVIRARPEDFVVREQLGFEPSGAGEHVFLHIEKTGLNTLDLQQQLSRISSVAPRNIGFSGLKDRNAVTRQWFSVGMAGAVEPNWCELEHGGEVKVLSVHRHARKLKRGVHRANSFELRLSDLGGDLDALEQRLHTVAKQGVPNYFGEQRFGRGGQTLLQARGWMNQGRRKITRTRRSLYLSALRAFIFNQMLADRVKRGEWNQLLDGDVCMLHGTRSRFSCVHRDEDILRRCEKADLHPGLPLWGRGRSESGPAVLAQQMAALGDDSAVCDFLEEQGLSLDYRCTRLLADDFSWRFCDDGSLQLQFTLAPGGYATAVLAELVNYEQGMLRSAKGSE